MRGVLFLMKRRPPRSTQSRSSAASDVYKRQIEITAEGSPTVTVDGQLFEQMGEGDVVKVRRAGTVARLVRTGRTAFYQQLDSRLGFGDRYDR